MIDYNNSVVLIGAVGAGKSLIARTLSKKYGIEYITLDEFRHLPSITHINNVLNNVNTTPKKYDEFVRLKELREKYPNIRSYDDFGFNMYAAEYLRKNFGIVAWHYYVKPFENMLIKEVCEKVNGAIILDTGGGFAVSMDSRYLELKSKFESIDKELFYKEFKHLEYVGKDVTYNLFKPFKHIYHITVSQNGISDKAKENDLNNYLLQSGDYEKICTDTIDTSGLFSNKPFSEDRLLNITNKIEQTYRSKTSDDTM